MDIDEIERRIVEQYELLAYALECGAKAMAKDFEKLAEIQAENNKLADQLERRMMNNL